MLKYSRISEFFVIVMIKIKSWYHKLEPRKDELQTFILKRVLFKKIVILQMKHYILIFFFLSESYFN